MFKIPSTCQFRFKTSACRTSPKPCTSMWNPRRLSALGAACIVAVAPTCALSASETTEGSPSRSQELTPGKASDVKGTAPSGDQPSNVRYTHLWTSKNGETHISECEMKGFILKSFAQKGAPQYVKQSSVQPDKISWTQLPAGTKSDLHSCPGVQFVFDMQGSWYVETTDGTRKEFLPGEILFQDNTENSPAQKQPQHKSGTAGSELCNQMVLQVDRAPEVDNACPF